jgi:hypothetical protein
MLNLRRLSSLALIGSQLALASAQAADLGDNTNYVSDHGTLEARARVLTNGDRKIVIIPMIHVSTGRFYKGVTAELKKYDDGGAAILQEGVGLCGRKGDPLHTVWIPGENFDATVAAQLYSSGAALTEADLEHAGYAKQDCDDEKPPGFFARIKDEYFSTYSIIGAIFFLRSQTNELHLYPKGMPRRDGDIIGAHLTQLRDQMVFDSMVSCFEKFVRSGAGASASPGKSRCDRVDSFLHGVDTNSYIVGLRNQVLMAKLLKTLGLPADPALDARYETNASELGEAKKTAILAWGADHFVADDGAFPKALAALGFGFSSSSEIAIASCKRVHRNLMLNQTSSGVCN